MDRNQGVERGPQRCAGLGAPRSDRALMGAAAAWVTTPLTALARRTL